MAEVVGIAGSIVGFVGLTGQIVRGYVVFVRSDSLAVANKIIRISYLSNFFQGVKDAPEDIRILLTELAILRPLAERVETHAKQCSDLPAGVVQAEIEPGLKYCADSIVSLKELVKKYDIPSDRMRGLMRRASFVFANKQFDKHMGKLERSKGYLIFAQTVLMR